MLGPGAIFIGRMAETLPVTLLVFAVVYTSTKKKRGLLSSILRGIGLAGTRSTSRLTSGTSRA